MICGECGCELNYDMETTLYLKCPCCDSVLIDASDEENGMTAIVIDYGIEHHKDGAWMWVETEDERGIRNTYWKKRD